MRISTVRCCRVCRDLSRPAMRFNLNVTIPAMTKIVRGAGATELCEDCWRGLVAGFPRRGGSPPR